LFSNVFAGGFFLIWFNGVEFVLLGVEVKEPTKETNNNRLLKKIGEYLKSDSYMYASLVASSQSISPLIGTFTCDSFFLFLLFLV
jgi:hypothetical protein